MSFKPNSRAARDLNSLLHPSTNLAKHEETGPFVLERGKGVYVYDDEGRPYIEAMAGLWCTALGYGVEELADVAAEQMKKLAYSPLFASKSHDPAIELGERLVAMMPFPNGKVIFGNSGSDANDTHVKLLWYYNNAVGRPRKKKIISRIKAYHGVTVASASLTGLPLMHADFDLPIGGVLHGDCPHHYRFALPGESEEAFAARLAANLEALIAREGAETIAAFIAEPVMGAGGVIIPPKGYFDRIRPILKANDILFIDDEVITGFYRTGKRFGAETLAFQPDAMTIAKAMSSAYLPISATIVPDEIYRAAVEQSRKLGSFGHGYTYSGHPAACAVSVKTLDLMDTWKIGDHVARVGPHFEKRVKALGHHPLVGEARALGLIGALEIVRDKTSKAQYPAKAGVGAYIAARLQAHGVIVRALPGDAIAYCPPLVINESEIDTVFERTALALDETAAWIKKERVGE